ncbi:hypothetical protein DBA31_15785 [Yersinia pestis]|nr:hypothetical protein DBA31_15785 [Yersinia pestis]
MFHFFSWSGRFSDRLINEKNLKIKGGINRPLSILQVSASITASGHDTVYISYPNHMGTDHYAPLYAQGC